MRFNEQYTVENFIIKYLQEKLGYDYISPAEFSKLRNFENEFIIIPHLLEAIKKINNIDDDIAENVLREIKKLDNNEAFLSVMRNGVDLVDNETRKTVNYKVVEFEEMISFDSAGAPLRMTTNKFVVTNQFYFEGNGENIRPDIMVFVNGLPLVDIEAKSPTASTSVNYENAIDQIKRYERNAVKLFWPNCFNIATDGLKTVYGATYAPKQYFGEWKDEELEKKLGGNLERKREENKKNVSVSTNEGDK